MDHNCVALQIQTPFRFGNTNWIAQRCDYLTFGRNSYVCQKNVKENTCKVPFTNQPKPTTNKTTQTTKKTTTKKTTTKITATTKTTATTKSKVRLERQQNFANIF